MSKTIQARTLSVLGSVLIICSLLAIFTIGYKAKNLLIVGILSGLISWGLAVMLSRNSIPQWTSMAFTLIACVVFGQRALANLLAVIGIVQHATNFDAYNKCITIILLLIMTMASVTSLIMVYTFQAAEPDKS
jgi:hypothetical protein